MPADLQHRVRNAKLRFRLRRRPGLRLRTRRRPHHTELCPRMRARVQHETGRTVTAPNLVPGVVLADRDRGLAPIYYG